MYTSMESAVVSLREAIEPISGSEADMASDEVISFLVGVLPGASPDDHNVEAMQALMEIGFILGRRSQ